MTAQAGRDMLIKLGDGASEESFASVAGLRAKALSLNARTIDATHADSPGQWRELIAGAGVKSAAVTGTGIFLSGEGDSAIRQAFFGGTTPNFQLVIPEFGVIEGPFAVSALEYAGRHDGEATFSISLASAGALSFEAL